jgi:hypothetical protein
MKKYLKITGSTIGMLALATGVGAGINWAKPEAPSTALVSSDVRASVRTEPPQVGCNQFGCAWSATQAGSLTVAGWDGPIPVVKASTTSTQQPYAVMVPYGAKLSDNFLSSNAGYVPLANTTALVGGTAKIQIYSATPDVRISVGAPPELIAYSSGALLGNYNLGQATTLPGSLVNNRSLSINPLSSYSTIAGSSYIDWAWMQSKQMNPLSRISKAVQCTSVTSSVACFPQGGKHPQSLIVKLAPMTPKTVPALLEKFGMSETAKYSAVITLDGPAKTFTDLSVEEAK